MFLTVCTGLILVLGIYFTSHYQIKKNTPGDDDGLSQIAKELRIQGCIEELRAELKDPKGQTFAASTAKIYCRCYMNEVFERGLNSEAEGDFIGTEDWKIISDRCYALAQKNSE